MESAGFHKNAAFRDTLENRALPGLCDPCKDKFTLGRKSQLQSGWLVERAGRTGVHGSSAWFLSWVRILHEILTAPLWKADFPSVGVPRQFPACPHHQQCPLHLLPTSFPWISPSFFNPSFLHLTLFTLFNISLVTCAMGPPLPHTFPADRIPNWNWLFLLSLSPAAGSCSALLLGMLSPSLKVSRILLCDILACSRLMIPSRFASSAHFLCLPLLCVPRSLMQMSSRIFFEAETQGTVWVTPSECDTAPFS